MKNIKLGFNKLAFYLLYCVRNISIRNRLILFLTIISCVPIVILGFLSYTFSKNAIINQASQSVGELLYEISSNIDKDFLQLEILIMEITSNKSIKNVLMEEKPLDDLEFSSRKNKIYVDYIEQRVNSRRLINNVIFYSAKNYAYSFGRIPESATEGFKKFDVYVGAVRDFNKPTWFGTHVYEGSYSGTQFGGILSVARTVSQWKKDHFIGVIEIQLNEKLLRQYYSGISSEKVGELLITDADGKVLSSADGSLVGTNLSFNNGINLLNNEKGAFITKINNQKSMVTYDTLETNKWKIISIQPYKKLIANSLRLRTVTIILIFSCVVAAVLASVVLALSIVNPIKSIIYYMNKAEDGNFKLKIKDYGNNELGQLGKKFNSMIEKIDKLFSELALEQKLKKEAEFSLLQAQITPHFLYNTLNTIRCLAEINNQKQISSMIKSLIELLQYSTNNTNEFVTVSEELKLVQNYALLQKTRYNDLFEIEYEVEDSILKNKTLKFVIQPLIENAIFHGFKSFKDGGLIKVRGYAEGNRLILEVIDNGCGMSQEEMIRIFEESPKYRHSKLSGIGIRNVNDRIRFFFGDSYGLFYDSIPGNGTVAKVVFPLFTEFHDKMDGKGYLYQKPLIGGKL